MATRAWFRWSNLWVPAIALAALALFANASINASTFGAINRWSQFTGTALWPYVTILGDTAVALTLFLPLAFRRRDMLWALLLSGLIATLFVHGVKPLMSEPRPPSVLPPDQITVIGPAYKAQSFPSGHTTTIFVAAAIVWLHMKSNSLRYGALALAVLVGLSRAVVGVHWPIDIAGGAAGGWIATLIGSAIAARLPFGRSAVSHAMITAILIGCAIALLAGVNTGYPQAAQLQYAIGAIALGSLAFAIANALSLQSEASAPHAHSSTH